MISACDVLCLPSSGEAFGAVVLEAWMYRKPVVAGPAPALREVVQHGVDGLIVDRDPEQIANALIALLDHPDDAQAMGEAGYHKVTNNFTWGHVYERSMTAYQQALASR